MKTAQEIKEGRELIARFVNFSWSSGCIKDLQPGRLGKYVERKIKYDKYWGLLIPACKEFDLAIDGITNPLIHGFFGETRREIHNCLTHYNIEKCFEALVKGIKKYNEIKK